ncbi:hypothetical protein LPB140_01280 [Sphingorhabdus lutea]|uniref:Sulfatase N-terminal domain-containing protein n=1 Tax=Sphingorhabdus lutea TaxID=1913578 RepID=A0A1L3J975_9SPHN|nr:sulfatase-like hydrolase/transferase [Sphingorhabdus lutea]APG61692.1 hypothetical protein LPB140_01280 [Sphingorhabdus lutea]
MTGKAMGSKLFSIDRADFGRFANWCLIWLFMANIGFMALWFVGAPLRPWEILYGGLAGLIAKYLPRILRYIIFIGVVTWSCLKFIGGLFNLTIESLLYSVQFFAEIDPSDSIEYILAGFFTFIILIFVWKLMKRDTNFKNPLLIIAAAGLTFALSQFDIYMGKDMRGHYFRSPDAGAEFASARMNSGFANAPDGKRHLLLIVVESLGQPADNDEIKRKLFGQLKNNPAIAARFELKQGIAPYYNSTTSGEIRELCGRWGDYYSLLNNKITLDKNCLPYQLTQKGYQTHALHSFNGRFFKRAIWYPKTGFQQVEFGDKLIKRGAEMCGGVFPGACDRDVPPMIGDILRKADKPTFLYWLSLNTHLPVPTGKNLRVENCEKSSAILKEKFPMICRQFAIFDQIEAGLVAQIIAKDFPATDILIVGDHMPPFFDKHNRTQFDPAHVPWLYLRWKNGQ